MKSQRRVRAQFHSEQVFILAGRRHVQDIRSLLGGRAPHGEICRNGLSTAFSQLGKLRAYDKSRYRVVPDKDGLAKVARLTSPRSSKCGLRLRAERYRRSFHSRVTSSIRRIARTDRRQVLGRPSDPPEPVGL